jgi:hypothetical protein
LESQRWEADPAAMALHSMLVLLLAFVGFCMLQGRAAGRPLSTTTNAFMPFQYSKFQKNFFVAWSESNVAAVDGGHTLQLSLNRKSGELEQKMAQSVPLLIKFFLFFLVSIFVRWLGISHEVYVRSRLTKNQCGRKSSTYICSSLCFQRVYQ